jgi:hypothetical protein
MRFCDVSGWVVTMLKYQNIAYCHDFTWTGTKFLLAFFKLFVNNSIRINIRAKNMPSINDLKPGTIIELDGVPYQVLEVAHT